VDHGCTSRSLTLHNQGWAKTGYRASIRSHSFAIIFNLERDNRQAAHRHWGMERPTSPEMFPLKFRWPEHSMYRDTPRLLEPPTLDNHPSFAPNSHLLLMRECR